MTEQAVRSIPFLRRLAQGAPWGMACLDAELRFTVCNDTQAGYFARAAHDIIGRPLREVVPANPEFCRDIERVVATGDDYPQAALSVTWSHRPAEGEHHFLVGYVAEKDENGQVVGVF
jgi:PAS domain-containing protein